jgi:hypothetical protein
MLTWCQYFLIVYVYLQLTFVYSTISIEKANVPFAVTGKAFNNRNASPFACHNDTQFAIFCIQCLHIKHKTLCI